MPRPKKPTAPVTLTLDAEERAVVYNLGYYAVLAPAFEAAELDREPDDGILASIKHLREVMALYDQLGWEREDPRQKFKVKASWLTLVEWLGRLERDAARSLTTSVRGLRWSAGDFEFGEAGDEISRSVRELGIVTNLLRRIGGRWREEDKRWDDGEPNWHRVFEEHKGEAAGLVFDRLRSELPLVSMRGLFDIARREHAQAAEAV